MKKKFRTALSERCKDFGLTDKALDDLTELGIKSLKDDASDEDITKAVDLLVPYAKAIQGEITRKTRKTTQSAEKPSSEQQHRLPPKEGNRQPPAHSQENNPEEALQTKIRSAFRTVYSPLR